MAVLHHAFRCSVTPEFAQQISELLAACQAGDHAQLSDLALAGYGSLSQREDVHTAFYLDPEGGAPSWMQPDYITPGLAAIVLLASGFVTIPSLSASKDTNHYLLETQLPLLGWSAEEIRLLVRGQPIETMLRTYAVPGLQLDQDGFRHTGGWTPGLAAQALKGRLDQLGRGVASDADGAAKAAWSLLADSNALSDAQAMLAAIGDTDWLVMAITQ